MSWPDPPLERSIFAVDPRDEFAVVVSEWIWKEIQALDPARGAIEIEAKLGTLIDQTSQQRVQLPLLTESITDFQPGETRFEAQVTPNQHQTLNSILNDTVAQSNKPGYQGCHVTYQRVQSTDTFHAPEPRDHVPAKSRIRLTRDHKTGTKTAMVKTRLASRDIFSPQGVLDYRISINVEAPHPVPSSPAVLTREKERLSYKHQVSQVDITTVSAPNKPRSYEVEVEMQDGNELLELARACKENAQAHEWTPFEDRILIFLNNVRLLLRNVPFPE